MEKKSTATRTAHCLVLAFPAHGHINPLLQFSKLLVHQGVRVTFVTTIFHAKIMQKVPPSIALETISDGFDEVGLAGAVSLKAYAENFWEVGPLTFGKLLEKLGRSKDEHVDCVVYDSFFPWALDVAKRFGIVGAAYLTQNMTVNSIYYHVHTGKLQVPLIQHEFSLPTLPKLQPQDLPTFFLTYERKQFLLQYPVAQFSNIEKADWILCNTFYEMDKEIIDWIMEIWPKFRSIGPNIPSFFLDKQYEDDQDYGVTEFKRDECIEWLDDKPKGSVVYVSFGSIATFNKEQMEEIGCCLKECSHYYLWVVRKSEETNLPKDFEKKTEKGFVVRWCSQLKVLAHEAIGCFVTHCGWNSTLETLCLGVPIIAIPFWSDQSTNAKLMEDVWKMGIRAPFDDKKVVRRDALKHCIREIMEFEKGNEMKNNANQWRTLAIKAVKSGGSSHQNILEFINSLFYLECRARF
ncbi:hypothetical protein PHAVU_004G024500 [Phaseolus vulgaris]|uniref:Glycosyltransferase n=1 Tax=Phaseolus vulgaris TaxID=3885 RepID=V7BZ31_PHAVU|nr:hypothetical protein PHAVU_004G024500g [Phaseolus vulgaris]ESW23172.1 hypothetical protein PHAVU_004G024500g [Phaseolus vulgaris]